MPESKPKRTIRKPQQQRRPGKESEMKPEPVFDDATVLGSGKLRGKIALITGGDSGIGRAVAVLFAKEGADIVIVYLNEDKDALETQRIIEEEYKRRCMLIAADISNEKKCIRVVKTAMKEMDRLDILVNNAAIHYEKESLADITAQQLQKTFATNVFSMFYITREALPYMRKGGSIINTTSVTAYRGSPQLLDYSSTKGAIVSFTRSLSANLVDKGIRVNAVAPGPIWTPLIPASFNPKRVAQHGSNVPLARAGEPVEVAPSFLFLASSDSSYMTGQVLHPNGGEIVNG
jgi:NAD(P)-dependent dehydrogenase (short-subunit alcohol dehydrogenase family)